MGKGISIGVGADTREFSAGVKSGVVQPLEDVADALDDVGKDGDKAGEKLEKSLDDARKSAKELGTEGKAAGTKLERAMKDAEAETKDLGREHSKLGDVIDRESKRAGDSLGKNIKRGTDEGKEGLGEFRDEAKSSAREGAASFSGEFDDVGDFIQEVAANAFEGFGPAGTAAGIAAAVGIGLIFSELERTKEQAEATREQVKGILDQLFESGGNPALLDYVSQLREFLDKPAANGDMISQLEDFFKQSGTNFDKATRDAKEFGVSLTDMLKAYSGGDADAAKRVIDDLTVSMEKLKKERDSSAGGYDWSQLNRQVRGYEDVISKIKEQNSLTDEAIAQYDLISQATNEMAAEQQAAADKITAVSDAISSLQSEIDESVSGFADFQDAETGALDPAGYIASIAARIEATSNFNSNVQGLATQFGLTDEEIQSILDQGMDFAPMLQSIMDSGLAPEFITQIQNAVGGGADILNANPLSTKVDVKADTKPAEGDIGKVRDAKTETTIKTKADTKPATDALAAAAAGSYTATIGTALDLGGVESALNSFLNRPRTVNVTVRGVTPDGKPVF